MANPNIVSVTKIYGTTAYITPANTTANVLLSNAVSSGKVFKINQIVAANVNGSAAVNTTISINSAAAGAGTNFPIVSVVSVPTNASLIVVDKTTAIYLMENSSIVVTSGTSSGITYSISYEDITDQP
jgi:hypothetical protein